MNVSLGLLGASGKVGRRICHLLSTKPQYGEDKLQLGRTVYRSQPSSIDDTQVKQAKFEEAWEDDMHAWIDFSHPEATISLLRRISSPILIATTGFNASELSVIRTYAQTHPVILAANTSPGIAIVNGWLRSMKAFGLSYDVVISETHHKMKRDSPSGTAIKLKETLNDQGFEPVQVSATRAGGVKGIHSIQFIGDDETLEIQHSALSRDLFVRGALLGALFLTKQKNPGFYQMEDIFLENDYESN